MHLVRERYAAAGSLFVFKGIYKAVLINYPSHASKAAMLAGPPAGVRT